jgi:hypothetical protein
MHTGPSDDSKTTRAAGFPFLLCGLVFLGVGLATAQVAFLGVGPAFVAIGIALLARKRAPRH